MLRAVRALDRFFATHPLTRDARLGAWTRFAVWQVRSRLSDEVVHDWIGGQKLAIRRGMSGATGNIYTGLHEFADMMTPLHFLRENDLFLDIGANVGTYTVLAAGVRGAQVWAFEPDPDVAALLRRNLALNDLQSRVRVHETALGPHDGEVRFTIGQDCVNHVLEDGASAGRVVAQRRLDGLVADARPIMAKIDVEGYEENVLAGAREMLARGDLKVLEVETVSANAADMLAGFGYQRTYYDPFRRALVDAPVHPTNNTLYVRDKDFVAARLASASPVSVLGRSI